MDESLKAIAEIIEEWKSGKLPSDVAIITIRGELVGYEEQDDLEVYS